MPRRLGRLFRAGRPDVDLSIVWISRKVPGDGEGAPAFSSDGQGNARDCIASLVQDLIEAIETIVEPPSRSLQGRFDLRPPVEKHLCLILRSGGIERALSGGRKEIADNGCHVWHRANGLDVDARSEENTAELQA